MTTVATFEVPYTRFLDADGKVVAPLPAFAEDDEHLVRLYRAMVLTRRFDAKGVALQRTGRTGTRFGASGLDSFAGLYLPFVSFIVTVQLAAISCARSLVRPRRICTDCTSSVIAS